MSYREKYAEIVKAGRRESKNIGEKAQNAVIDTFALMEEADATITALRQRVAELERELEAARKVIGQSKRKAQAALKAAKGRKTT